jgi:hypothetical protein
MVMVDKVISADHGVIVTELEIRPDNILLSGEIFLEGGMVEHLAQSYILACLTEANSQEEDAVFLLGGLKKSHVHRYPGIGETIRSEVKRTLFAMGIHQLQGNVYLGDELIFESIITVLQKKDE